VRIVTTKPESGPRLESEDDMFSKAMTGFVTAGLLLSGQAFADPYDSRYGGAYDYAKVVDVDPIVRQVRVTTPRRECWTETRYEVIERRPEPQRGAAGSMILGGIIGAALGNTIGDGDGRRAATVAGAVIGSAIGHDVAVRREARSGGYSYTREERPYDVERCEVRYEQSYEERIDGYRVTYVYNGRTQTTRLPYDPGDRIRVRVDVRPAE
jgi:uncharacterized protein YcfJ